MLIDWDEAQRLIDQADQAQRESRARRWQLTEALRRVDGRQPLRGVDFHAAAAVQLATPRLVQHVFSPYVHDDRLDTLFSHARVRAAVADALRRADSPRRRGFIERVASCLETRDAEAARLLRACHDPDQASIGVHVHADQLAPDGVGAVMLKRERRRCWLRICPECAKDHAARLRKRYERRLQLVSQTRAPGCSLKMLVLTMARTDDLRADLVKLHQCTKRLVKHFWPGKDQGAFATAEVGPQGGNVHVHVIVYGRYVAQAKISDHWQALTGNRVVWIKKTTPSQAVREGIKYISKLAKRDAHGQFITEPADLAELHHAIKGRRRVWSWGCFYGIGDGDSDAAPAPDPDDPDPEGRACRCGERMVFMTVPEARHWLHLKGATNCQAWGAAAASYSPPARAGP